MHVPLNVKLLASQGLCYIELESCSCISRNH